MSQTWTNDTFALSNTGATDLQNIENNLLTLKSSWSGSSSPGYNEDGQLWYRTDTDTLKVRLNSAWVAIMTGDTSQIVWVYRNSAPDGWTVSSALTDRVLAVKGGTTYTTGGAAAGSWTMSGLSNSTQSANHTHYISGQTVNTYHRHLPIATAYTTGFKKGSSEDTGYYEDYQGSASAAVSATTSGANSASHTHTISGSTWRPAAAVGTMQYPKA